MTEEEIERLIENREAKFIGLGRYNHAKVFKTSFTIDGYTCYWVERIPRHPKDPLSNTTRAIRKWRLINPQYPVHKTRQGMLTPYFGPLSFIDGTEPVNFSYSDDNRRADKLLEIYRRTKNLLYDIGVISNVMVYANPLTKENEDVVVDPDFALEVGSVATDEYYQHYIENDFLIGCKQRGMLKTATLIETIRYMETQLPSEKIQHQRITRLICERLNYFAANHLPITEELLNFLLDWQDADPLNEYQLETLPIQLLCQGNFPSDTSTRTKAQLAQIIIDYILENMGQEKEAKIIARLTIAFTYSPTLKNKLNQQGYTLAHLAVIHGYYGLLRYLIEHEIDITIKTPPLPHGRKFNYADMTAFEMAIIIGAPRKMIRLFQSKNASIPDALQHILPPEQWPSPLCQTETYTLLYQTLTAFCNGQIQTLWDTQFWSNIIHYPEVLTWPIDDNGYTALHHIFRRTDRAVINYLISMDDWSPLKLTKNLRNQHTLFDFMAIHGNVHYYVHLKSLASTPLEKMRVLSLAVKASQFDFTLQLLADGYNPNHTPHHTPSLLSIAGQQSNEFICALLLEYGANPNTYRLNRPLYKEWAGPDDQNPIKQFAANLERLGKGLLEHDKQAQWIVFLHKYPWFLDWPLSERGSTCLHYCFRFNQSHIIAGLFTHPQWPQLAKTANQRTHITLFDEIIMAGHLDYYEQLKPSHEDQAAYDKALTYATRMGQVQSCLRLISDGANPETLMSSRHIPCYQYWANEHPHTENPFTEYLQNVWQQQKTIVLDQLENIRSKYGIGTYHFFAFNKEIRNYFGLLKADMMRMTFNVRKRFEDSLADILDNYFQNIDTTFSTTEQQIIQTIIYEIGCSLGIQAKFEHTIIAMEEIPDAESFAPRLEA